MVKITEKLRRFAEMRKRLGGLPCGYDFMLEAADLIEQLQQRNAEMESHLFDTVNERNKLSAQCRLLKEDVFELIQNSTGVAGLHQNGDIAHWDDLRKGGPHEGWLRSLDETPEQSLAVVSELERYNIAHEAYKRAIYKWEGEAILSTTQIDHIEILADAYAESVKAGS